jgi:zinc/manganese transport system substrate-binding protein
MNFKNTKPAYLLASIAFSLGFNTLAFAEDRIPVVASFSILGDIVSEIGREHIDLTTLVKINGDTHVYSPTPKDALAVRNAKLLVVNGLNFEGWMPRLLESAHFNGTTIVASNGIDVIKIGDDHDEHDADHHEDEEHAGEHHHHGGIDPHSWSSIVNVKIYVKNIAAGLSKIDPENSKDYQDNAQVYLQKLEKLEVKLHAQLDVIPLSDRVVITPHNAFRYFGRDFKMEFMAPQGTSTESEASASDVAAIIKQIKEHNVSAVFIENIADNRIVQQISRETKAKIGGVLYTGSLSEKQGPAPTYLKMMEYNVNTIASALTK